MAPLRRKISIIGIIHADPTFIDKDQFLELEGKKIYIHPK
jgi:hypothetical protein